MPVEDDPLDSSEVTGVGIKLVLSDGNFLVTTFRYAYSSKPGG